MPKSKEPFEELKFMRYFSDFSHRVLPGCTLIKKEASLYSAQEVLKRDVYEKINSGKWVGYKNTIGRIDAIFEWKGKIFIAEVKYQDPFSGGDFWDALKIVGYKTLYDWTMELTSGRVKTNAAIIMPEDKIKLEHRIVANALKIYIFGIEKKPKSYSVKLLHNPRTSRYEKN